MLKKRRAQGISFNVIIIAVLALVVLVVVIAIFSQKTGNSVTSLESCPGKGGTCKSACLPDEFVLPNGECQNQVCCAKVPG